VPDRCLKWHSAGLLRDQHKAKQRQDDAFHGISIGSSFDPGRRVDEAVRHKLRAKSRIPRNLPRTFQASRGMAWLVLIARDGEVAAIWPS
jgi:hypothetical protein